MGKQVWKGGNMLYPLPAVMVSCQREGERPNIVTVAWAGTVCTNPAMVSISLRPSRYSYEIIKESGSFVVNLTTKELTRAMDYCGARSGRDVDKFEKMGLTAVRAAKVSAPLIKESPVNIECRVQQIMALGSHHMILATVEAVDVDEQYLDATGKFDLNKADLVTYSHGTYFALGEQVGTFGYSVRKESAAVVAKVQKKYSANEAKARRTEASGTAKARRGEASGTAKARRGEAQGTAKARAVKHREQQKRAAVKHREQRIGEKKNLPQSGFSLKAEQRQVPG